MKCLHLLLEMDMQKWSKGLLGKKVRRWRLHGRRWSRLRWCGQRRADGGASPQPSDLLACPLRGKQPGVESPGSISPCERPDRGSEFWTEGTRTKQTDKFSRGSSLQRAGFLHGEQDSFPPVIRLPN